MKSNALAIFNSNDIYPTGADSTLPFEQHRDIFYLSGIDQEESILLLFPSSSDQRQREVLFIKETNEHIAIWEGEKLTKEQAFEKSGIETIYWLQDFERVFRTMMKEAESIYFNTNEHARYKAEVETREDRFIKDCIARFPAHQVAKSNPILHQLRAVKEQLEIETIKKAASITTSAYQRVLQFLKPGVFEFEIEAEFIHEFIRSRSKGFAYTPIIASGYSACVLHYIENNKMCNDGDLLLLDVAAEYGNYSSDVTRSYPVSGRFSERQKAVYQAVLNTKNFATSLLKPSTDWKNYNEEVGKFMSSELLQLGLLTKSDIQSQTKDYPAYKKYFMHGTSHHLGLDTHDYGSQEGLFKPNMVLTVEPGIYIPKENLGIRLEDDMVVQASGEALNLTKDIPIEIDHIEDIMNS